jgi:hypothetical protein
MFSCSCASAYLLPAHRCLASAQHPEDLVRAVLAAQALAGPEPDPCPPLQVHGQQLHCVNGASARSLTCTCML